LATGFEEADVTSYSTLSFLFSPDLWSFEELSVVFPVGVDLLMFKLVLYESGLTDPDVPASICVGSFG